MLQFVVNGNPCTNGLHCKEASFNLPSIWIKIFLLSVLYRSAKQWVILSHCVWYVSVCIWMAFITAEVFWARTEDSFRMSQRVEYFSFLICVTATQIAELRDRTYGLECMSVCVWVFMALITAVVLRARFKNSLLSVSVCWVHVAFSTAGYKGGGKPWMRCLNHNATRSPHCVGVMRF